jgi:hypothetical protein
VNHEHNSSTCDRGSGNCCRDELHRAVGMEDLVWKIVEGLWRRLRKVCCHTRTETRRTIPAAAVVMSGSYLIEGKRMFDSSSIVNSKGGKLLVFASTVA